MTLMVPLDSHPGQPADRKGLASFGWIAYQLLRGGRIMDIAQIISWLVLLVLVVVTVGIVYWLIGKPLRPILDELIRMPACTDFYCRVFAVALLFTGLGTVIGSQKFGGKDQAFMDYVWSVLGYWSGMVDELMVLALLYIVIITLLVAILRRRDG